MSTSTTLLDRSSTPKEVLVLILSFGHLNLDTACTFPRVSRKFRQAFEELVRRRADELLLASKRLRNQQLGCFAQFVSVFRVDDNAEDAQLHVPSLEQSALIAHASQAFCPLIRTLKEAEFWCLLSAFYRGCSSVCIFGLNVMRTSTQFAVVIGATSNAKAKVEWAWRRWQVSMETKYKLIDGNVQPVDFSIIRQHAMTRQQKYFFADGVQSTRETKKLRGV